MASLMDLIKEPSIAFCWHVFYHPCVISMGHSINHSNVMKAHKIEKLQGTILVKLGLSFMSQDRVRVNVTNDAL